MEGIDKSNLSNLTDGQLIQKAKALVQKGILEKDEAGSEWVALGRIILELKSRSSVSNFSIDCKSIGISQRMAYYLIELHKVMTVNRLRPPPGVSWRKLTETFKILTWANAEIVFNYCLTHTREEVVAWVEKQRR